MRGEYSIWKNNQHPNSYPPEKMSNGKIKIDVKSVVPGVFAVTVIESSVTRNLKASDYISFREDLEFAGLSFKGKSLSIPNSIGPASISGFSLKLSPPGDDWVCIDNFSGVLIKTDKPEV